MCDLEEKFLCFEKNFALFDNQFWHYARLELYRFIESKINNTYQVPVFDRQPLVNLMIESSLPQKNIDILVINNYDRFVELDNKMICAATEYFHKLDGITTCDLSLSFKKRRIFFTGLSTFKKINDSYKLTVHIFSQFLYRKFVDLVCPEINIGELNAFLRKLEEYLSNVFALKGVFKKYIKKIAPKIMVFENSYNPLFMMMVEIAHDAGISTIDAQHGHFDGTHIAYNCRANGRFKYNTDELFVYNVYYTKCAFTFQKPQNITIVGNYLLNQMSKKKRNPPIYDVLFVSNAESSLIREYAVTVAKENIYKILYRFHPEEYITSDYIKKLTMEGIICENSNKRNIYEALFESRIVVTYNSTVTYEAMNLGMSVIAIEDNRHPLNMECPNNVIKVSNIEQMMAVLKLQKYKNQLSNKQFFDINAVDERIRKLLEDKESPK